MSVGCLLSVVAARVAPTEPGVGAIESGNDYYLYNVGSGKFMSHGTFDLTAGDHGSTFTLTKSGDYYWISFKVPNYYGDLYPIYINGDDSKLSTGSGFNWNFAHKENDTYTIQLPDDNSYYAADKYMGIPADGSGGVLNNRTADDHIVWKVMTVAEGDMFMARRDLYNLLNWSEALGCYDISPFEAVYDNEASTLEQVREAVSMLSRSYELTKGYHAPDWSDFFIWFETTTGSDDYYNKWMKYNNDDNTLCCNLQPGCDATLTATVIVDHDATIVYDMSCYRNNVGDNYAVDVDILIDGEQVRTFARQMVHQNKRHFHELTAGKHTIQWRARNISDSYGCDVALSNIGVEKTPLITVSLLEPGSLGTEVLYNVDHLKDVRRLKVIGSMNDEDWAKINMMKGNLFALDLSETDVKEIKENQFYLSGDDWSFLHAVALPDGLQKIGRYAFRNGYVEEVNLPASLLSIGEYAFNGSMVREAIVPESCLSLGNGIFEDCQHLEKASLPSGLANVPNNMFDDCHNMRMAQLPANVRVIGDYAFYNCNLVAFDFPELLTSIGYRAFWCTNQEGAKERLVLPKNVSYVGSQAFAYCDLYASAEMATAFYRVTGYSMLPNSVKKLRLNSPTVVERDNSSNYIVNENAQQSVTLQVPSYLVNSYKLDEYWYNFGAIEGFSTAEVGEWPINRDLVLNARDRFEGTPSVSIYATGSLKVNGKDGMPMDNLMVESDPDNKLYGRVFSNADGVTVGGTLTTDLRVGTRNRWYYLCLPYDVRVSDIVKMNNNPKRAIRYYDGAGRAANGATGNWKNLADTDIIPAGTGFIFQVSEEGWWKLPSLDNESKQYATSNRMFVKALEENASENAADRGWNLVGNPYQCWYNIHKLNFSAPITVRENNNYAAYSVIDDDYALAPNQAFFVQSPEGIGSISFPLDGRQMTSVIESQSGAKAHLWLADQAQPRRLADLTVTNGRDTDRTRVVLNGSASADYEPACDACKFMSDDESVPQVYSYDNSGTRYAINERPEGDGIVKLGFKTGEGGCFTFTLGRNEAGSVLLVDNERGMTVDLSTQSYQFTAEAGTFDSRFELRMGGRGSATTISAPGTDGSIAVSALKGGISLSHVQGDVVVYTLGGATVATVHTNGDRVFVALPNGSYIVKAGDKSASVMVK